MAIQTGTERDALAAEYAADALYGALYTTSAGSSPGTEVTGGSPAYARKSLSWSDTGDGVQTATATFDVPAGTTVVAAGVHTASSGGTYLDGGSVTSQAFSTQGQYTLTFTYTQT